MTSCKPCNDTRDSPAVPEYDKAQCHSRATTQESILLAGRLYFVIGADYGCSGQRDICIFFID